MQSKHHSIAEAISQTIASFLIVGVISLMLGIPVDKSLLVTICSTIVLTLKNYSIRRFFNHKTIIQNQTTLAEKSQRDRIVQKAIARAITKNKKHCNKKVWARVYKNEK